MKTKYTIACLLALGTLSASAAITATSDNFSTNITSNGTWIHTGSNTTGVIIHRATSNDGGSSLGDMLANDGGLRFDTKDTDTNIVFTEGMGLSIAGAMETGEVITFSYGLHNDNSSFTNVTAQLWNLTDNVELASALTSLEGSGSVAYVPKDETINYTAQASDDGDVLQIRFSERGNSTARDIYVDNYSLTSVVPEPSSTALLGLGGLALIMRRRK